MLAGFTSIDVKEVQAIKVYCPMFVTLAGMVRESKEVQELKADIPMEITPVPIVMEDRAVQW